jgi:imidazoleglycerol-phosphate dehydratase
MNRRQATIRRTTRETTIVCTLTLDAWGHDAQDAPDAEDPNGAPIQVRTGVGFLDHLLTSLAFHAGWGLQLTCQGDLEIDDHHSAEDCALALGQALKQALGDRSGIRRFGSAYAPLDEALARAVVDISGRPHSTIALGLRRETIGALASENVAHVLSSLATAAALTLHVDLLRGENDHHRAEAAFKATALALREAVATSGDSRIPSTKGSLDEPREDRQ